MKKIFLILFFVCLGISIQAQQKNYAYCELVGIGKLFSKGVTVSVDFGQKQYFFKESSMMRDANGKKIEFNSMVDAMNFMGTRGWEFTQAYVITIGQQNVYHWLLRKEMTEEEKEKLESGSLEDLQIRNTDGQ